MIYGYVRVSTQEQSVDSQKNSISRYCIEQKLMVDEWIELEMSSRKSTALRRIDELLDRLSPDDVVIVSELSRLGRSIKETLNTIEVVVNQKQSRLVLIKQNLDLNPNDQNNVTNKILITIFSMLAELERDFISERTKDGIAAARLKGKTPGRPGLNPETLDSAIKLVESGVSPTNTAKQLHIGRSTLYRELKIRITNNC